MSTKIVSVNLSKENEQFTIIAAGDFHIGANAFNEIAFKVFVKQVKKEAARRQVFVLLMGDIFDSIPVGDKRFNLNERKNNMDDSQKLFKILIAPLINHPRITFVGSLIGNHEISFSRGDTDPIVRLHEMCGIPHLGIKSYIYFDLKYKKKKMATLRTVAFHGAKNSATDYGRLKIIKDFLKENDLTHDEFIRMNNIVFYGHTHDCRVEKVNKTLPSPRDDGTLRAVQYGCLTGSFYDIANFKTSSYAANKGLVPSIVGYIKVRVSMKEIVPEVVDDNGLNPDIEKINWTEM